MIRKPIFIICMHRSGSTLLKNILNRNSEVAMATDEMHLSVPFYKTFEDQYKSFDLTKTNEVNRLVDLIFSGKIKGTFWKDYSTLTGIKKSEVTQIIIESDRSLKSIISILLDEYRKLEKKPRVGVKYLVHHSRVNILLEWYPDAKIVILLRDIRAIIASKVSDETTRERKQKAGILGFLVHYFTILFFIFDFIWFNRTIKRLKSKNKCHIIQFENLGINTVNEIKNLCFFAEIPFEEGMLYACGKPSSHNGKIQYGFDEKRITTWEKKLNKFDQLLINILTYSEHKRKDI